MEEIWKDIKDYEGFYQVSNLGRVKSLSRNINHWKSGFSTIKERILKTSINGSGYYHVCLLKNKRSKTYRVHKLVSETFLNHISCGLKLVVNHVNFDKLDNRLENLEIITNRENSNRNHIKSSSQYTGVTWHKASKKWLAQIQIDGRYKYLGLFHNEIDASIAYKDELKKLIK